MMVMSCGKPQWKTSQPRKQAQHLPQLQAQDSDNGFDMMWMQNDSEHPIQKAHYGEM